MDENKFWNLINDTWVKSGKNKIRLKAIKENDEDLLRRLMEFIWTDLINYYQIELWKLEKQEFISYILKLEEKLYQIDREEIHKHIGGSDDRFLYGRCFVLAMGREYYEMIDKYPEKAKYDLQAEGFGFETYKLFENLFEEEFERNTIHCIESCSNEGKWSDNTAFYP